MTECVRRVTVVGFMVLALAFGVVATGGSAAAQVPAGGIVSYGGPVNNSGVQAYKVSGTTTTPVQVNTPSFADFYGFGYNGFGYNGYGYNGFGYGVPFYGYAPYGYGYNGNGYGVPYYGGTTLSANYGVGCVPQVSYTAAFGYGFGCQQIASSPFSYPVGYYR